LEVTKYLVDIPVKYLAGTPAKRLVDTSAKHLAKHPADILPAPEGTRDIIGLVVPSIAVAILPKPTDPLDNIKHYNILLIGLDTLAKYIYSILVIVAAYSI
jgi:hypothetical protein